MAIPHASAIAIRAERLDLIGPNALGATLRHEIAHVALARHAPGLPRWLDEGLAQWAAGRRLGPAERGALEAAARAGELPPLEEIARAFPARHDEADLAYAASLVFVEALVREFGEPRLRAFVRTIPRRGVEAAFEDAFAISLAAYGAALRERLAASWSFWRDLAYGASAITVAALLAVVAYLRYRRWRRRALAAMREAEAGGSGSAGGTLARGQSPPPSPEDAGGGGSGRAGISGSSS